MILGIHGGHNASVSLVYYDREVVKCKCIEAERIDRIKMSCGCEHYYENDFSPIAKSKWIQNHKTDLEELILYIIKECKIKINDIEQVVITNVTEMKRLPKWILEKKIIKINHHLAHIALSYYTSSFESALGIVIDGGGDIFNDGIETQTAWICEGNRITPLLETHLGENELGIGNVYELYSYWLGYGYNGCGTTMALASFDEREKSKDYKDIFYCSEKYDYKLKSSFVDVYGHFNKIGYSKKGTAAYNVEHENAMRGVPVPNGYKIRMKDENSLNEVYIHMAGDVQKATEQSVLNYIEYALSKYEAKNLCMSGGTFLNCNLNSLIRDKINVTNMHIPSAPNDSGLSLGVALYVFFINREKCKVDYTPYIGAVINEPSNIDDLLVFQPENIYDYTAKEISKGKLVAWCQGNAEFGPRALGHRSLLADPRKKDIPDKINKMLKHRESFRPFAPSVLEECFSEYFEGEYPIPYMLETRFVKKNMREVIPAIVHFDNSARVQVVRKCDSIDYYELINSFFKLTKVGVLLNTSLNRNGEPIVNTADEAIKLLKLNMVDEVIIGNKAYVRRNDE